MDDFIVKIKEIIWHKTMLIKIVNNKMIKKWAINVKLKIIIWHSIKMVKKRGSFKGIKIAKSSKVYL